MHTTEVKRMEGESLMNPPIVSKFLGIKVFMYLESGSRHHVPHIHVEYEHEEASVDYQKHKVLAGGIKPYALRQVFLWCRLHEEELHQRWIALQKRGENPSWIIGLDEEDI